MEEKKLVIDSQYVGEPWPVVKRRVTWHQTTDYAAVIGDMNPLYVDDERDGGVIAPPMFAVTCGWYVRRDYNKYSIKPLPDEILNNDVHYTLHVEYFKPIQPGINEDGVELSISPMIHALIPQRAGTNMVYRYEVRDEAGDLCHIEYNGCMLRGVSCPDGGKGELPATPAPSSTDNVIWSKKIHFSREMLYIYDMANSGGFAIHTSPRFAHSVGLPDPLVQGVQTIAVAVRELTYMFADGDGRRVKILAAKLKGMVFAENDVTIQLLEKDVHPEYTDLFYQVVNQEGKVVVGNGYLRLMA